MKPNFPHISRKQTSKPATSSIKARLALYSLYAMLLLFPVHGLLGAGPVPVSFDIASTGANAVGGKDQRYQIVSNTIAYAPASAVLGPAPLVTSPPTQAPGWPGVPGALWIAPDANQSNTRNGCCAGTFNVTTNFSLKDPATGTALDPSTVSLTLTFAADDGLDLYLYPTGQKILDAAHKLYSAGVFNAAVTKVFTTRNAPFVNGVTSYTLEFVVNNAGLGPTGLAVFAQGTAMPICILRDGTVCPSKLSVSPSSVVLTVLAGSPFSAATQQYLTVENKGSGGALPLTFSRVSTPQCPSLGSLPLAYSLLPQSVSSTTDPSLALRVYGTDPVGALTPPGISQGNLRITSGTQTQDVCIVANVLKVPSSFSINKTGLLFLAQTGEKPADQDMTISLPSTTGYQTNVTPIIPSDNFLVVTKGVGAASNKLTFSVLPQAVNGTHFATVRIVPTDPSLPARLVGVAYKVSATAPAPDLVPPEPVIVVQPSLATSSAPSVAGAFLIKRGSGSLSYTLTGPSYVTFSQTSGALSASDDTKISFSLDPSKLKLGINRQDISVTFQPGGLVESVPVMAVYIPRGAVAAALLPASVLPVQSKLAVSRSATTNCNPGQLGLVATGLPGGFNRPLGFSLPVQVRAIDDCGNPVGNANVMLTFSDGEQAVIAAPDNSAAGTYLANWNPSIAGDVTVMMRASAGALLSSALSGSAVIDGTITANNVPVISRGGTVNNLFPVASSPLAAGTVVSIYGVGLATVTKGATALPLPTAIDGTSVSVGGIDAPLYSVSPGQINVQLPTELLSSNNYPVIVKSNGALSALENILIADATPGVAAFADGTLIAQHANYQLVDAINPATQNEALILYLVGMGATIPAVTTGQVAPADPLARTTLTPIVTIDGKDAPVAYSGLTPGGIGLYQIVLTVPSGILNSGPKDVTISLNGANANPTKLLVSVP